MAVNCFARRAGEVGDLGVDRHRGIDSEAKRADDLFVCAGTAEPTTAEHRLAPLDVERRGRHEFLLTSSRRGAREMRAPLTRSSLRLRGELRRRIPRRLPEAHTVADVLPLLLRPLLEGLAER